MLVRTRSQQGCQSDLCAVLSKGLMCDFCLQVQDVRHDMFVSGHRRRGMRQRHGQPAQGDQLGQYCHTVCGPVLNALGRCHEYVIQGAHQALGECIVCRVHTQLIGQIPVGQTYESGQQISDARHRHFVRCIRQGFQV